MANNGTRIITGKIGHSHTGILKCLLAGELILRQAMLMQGKETDCNFSWLCQGSKFLCQTSVTLHKHKIHQILLYINNSRMLKQEYPKFQPS